MNQLHLKNNIKNLILIGIGAVLFIYSINFFGCVIHTLLLILGVLLLVVGVKRTGLLNRFLGQ